MHKEIDDETLKAALTMVLDHFVSGTIEVTAPGVWMLVKPRPETYKLVRINKPTKDDDKNRHLFTIK